MKIAHNYYVYIVECCDKSYYTGVTNNIERRIWEHNNDNNALAYTFKRRPVILRYCQRFQDITQAIAWENKLRVGQEKRKKHYLVKTGRRLSDWQSPHQQITRLQQAQTDSMLTERNHLKKICYLILLSHQVKIFS